ncbi:MULTISPECIES: hypothetical protein [unclassified Rhizobium]|uniref:DUF1254 domain-containing protein n=1 Tax=unclassified Rhizobium TaxID=2613769 RepID=UPI000712D7C5|nr:MULTISPECIES: hypothetical protein [unclassified Rhizobium]KQS96473.1 hypothetical protein ASG50_05335 [Rhizobium sp. Leaf386]KQT06312.1 hypothetical protein ASG42_01580 [Rhizobium sp. Leaf391]KQU09452.1 hypothetical protein ASG68_00040 [Rhizobium sp. Leaf453]
MRSILFAIIIGLVGAALLHIVIILTLPQFTGKDAYSRVLGLYEMDSFFSLTNEPGPTGLSNDDPFLRVAVCSFAVTGGPTRFVAKGSVPFWSVSIYDANSNEVFSMNDKTSVNGNLDLVMATPIQLVDIRKTPPESLAQSILVEMPEEEGYAVLRALAQTDSFEEPVRNFLSEASCEPFRR